MLRELSESEIRVLGCLIEKETTTPEYYPLSLNALMNACNQKSNRSPIVSYNEQEVEAALNLLKDKELADSASGTGSRVGKYRHRTREKFNLEDDEIAVLCVLFLRGPLTIGEVRTKSERMHKFSSLSEVESTLNKLISADPAWVVHLDRQPGQKERRYSHLAGGSIAESESKEVPIAENRPGEPDLSQRVQVLEVEVREIREEIAELKWEMKNKGVG